MMRLEKTIETHGRKIVVREFDAETVYSLLDWLEQHGGGGLKSHQLLHYKNDLLDIVKSCIAPDDGQPLDFDAMGFAALMEIVDGLQAVNQAFLTLLVKMSKMPLVGAGADSVN